MGSWLSASAPMYRSSRVIVILYEERWKKMREGVSDVMREKFIEWTNGVWTFSGENRIKIGHPAPVPNKTS